MLNIGSFLDSILAAISDRFAGHIAELIKGLLGGLIGLERPERSG